MDSPSFPEAESSNSESSIAAGASSSAGASSTLSRYESQKRRDWNTFCKYLKDHCPPLALGRCSGAHVLEFLRYLDQFGKTKVHTTSCPFYGQMNPPAPCPCPLRQAWGSLDALVGRLRAAFEEGGGKPETNPFAARAVRLYLREVRDLQSKARGISYEKKKEEADGETDGCDTVAADGSTLTGPRPPGERMNHEESKKGKWTNILWEYFVEVFPPKDPVKPTAMCKFCLKEVNCDPYKFGASMLIKHYKGCHKRREVEAFDAI